MAKSFADRVREKDRDQSTQKGLDQSAEKLRQMKSPKTSAKGRLIDGQLSDNKPTFDGQRTVNYPSKDRQETVKGPSIVGAPTYSRPLTDLASDPGPTFDRPLTDLNIDTARRDNDPVWFISDRQSIILGILIQKKDRVIRRSDLIRETGIPEGTVRRAISDLVQNQFITKPKRWRNKGSTYSIYNEICMRFMRERWPKILKEYGDPPFISHRSVNCPTFNRPLTDHGPTLHPTFNRPASRPSPIIEEEDLYISSSIRPEDYPLLSALGFGKHHLDEIVTIWKNKNLPLEALGESLERIEFQLQNQIPDSNGSPIGLGYVLNALKKGPYAKPKGYMTPQEKYARERLEEAQRIRKTMQDVFELECKNWWEQMTPEGRQEIYAKSPRRLKHESEKRVFREAYFREHVFSFTERKEC